MVTISERSFEDAIESALFRDGPDDPSARAGAVRETLRAYGENVPEMGDVAALVALRERGPGRFCG